MSVQAVVVWVQVRYLPREVAVAVVVIEEIGASGSVQKKKKSIGGSRGKEVRHLERCLNKKNAYL